MEVLKEYDYLKQENLGFCFCLKGEIRKICRWMQLGNCRIMSHNDLLLQVLQCNLRILTWSNVTGLTEIRVTL